MPHIQVPENEGLDSDTSDSPLPEFLSNPDIRFEVLVADRAAMCGVLEQLRCVTRSWGKIWGMRGLRFRAEGDGVAAGWVDDIEPFETESLV